MHLKTVVKKQTAKNVRQRVTPYVVLHGSRGSGGFYGSTGVPKRYKGFKVEGSTY